MKKNLIFFIVCLASQWILAQEISIREWQQRALDFNNRGEHDNAVIVLQQGLKQYPSSLPLEKDLITSLLLKRDFASAREIALPLVDRSTADEVCFQLAGNVLKALEEVKECEKLYIRGIKKFPKSGPLHSEFGELLWSSKDNRAIKYWEAGIALDPNFAGNYYNAATYYSLSPEGWRTLLYGEIYVNMESKSERAQTMKKLLWENYRAKALSASSAPEKTPFEAAVDTTFDQASAVLIQGLSIETLTMARTRFILDWFNKYDKTYPFRLFDHHQQLLDLSDNNMLLDLQDLFQC